MIKHICLINIFFLFSLSLLSGEIAELQHKADSLMGAGQLQPAADIYEEILRTSPQNLQVLYNASYNYLNMGRGDIAHTYLRRFIMHNDTSADVYNLLGLANEKIGEPDSAMACFSKAISLDNKFYEAYFNRGRSHALKANFDSARADFNFAKQNKTITPELYFSSGELYFYLKQYDSAITDLEKISNLPVYNYRYFTMLGDAYHALWPNDTVKLNKAIDYYKKSLDIEPNNVQTLNNRAFIYDKLLQYEKAAIDRDKIREIQLKTGLDPQTLSYKKLLQPDSCFSVMIPSTWKALMNITHDSEAVLLYDTTLVKQDTIPEGYVFEHGCEIKFHKNVFKYTPDDINQSVDLRDAKFVEMQAVRATQRKSSALNYAELSKKHFSPNKDTAKEIIKIALNVSYSRTRFFRLEYFCMTTTGNMLSISLWVPEAESLYYENLLDYIISTVTIPAE